MATASDNQPTWPITRPVLIFMWIQQEMTTSYSFLQLFEGLFPMEVIQCIIDSVNDKLTSEQPLTHGEFLRWIGVWVLISTVDGSD